MLALPRIDVRPSGARSSRLPEGESGSFVLDHAQYGEIRAWAPGMLPVLGFLVLPNWNRITVTQAEAQNLCAAVRAGGMVKNPCWRPCEKLNVGIWF